MSKYVINLPDEYDAYVQYVPDYVLSEMVQNAIKERMERKPTIKQETDKEDTIFLKIQELLENQKVPIQSVQASPIKEKKEIKKPVIMEAKEVSVPATGDDTMDDFLADIFK